MTAPDAPPAPPLPTPGDEVPVPLRGVTVIHGQTDRIRMGFGAFASRVAGRIGCDRDPSRHRPAWTFPPCG